MKKNNPYTALADCYEYFAKYCDYDLWSQYLLQTLKKYAVGKRGVDLGCGSGYFTRTMKKAGYDVTGVDVSEDMLKKAETLALEDKQIITFLLADMVSFKPFEKVDFVTVINDGFNYLDKNAIVKCIKNISKYVKNGGYLIFDVSSEYKLKNVLGNNMYGEDDEDFSYMWFNSFDGEKVTMDLTFFTRNGEYYTRRDERHVQYVHGLDSIKKALTENGFVVEETTGHLGQPLTDESDRIVFVAKKITGTL